MLLAGPQIVPGLINLQMKKHKFSIQKKQNVYKMRKFPGGLQKGLWRTHILKLPTA